MLPSPPPVDWSTSALFLDIDGTLLDFEAHPDDVRADAELIVLLQRISILLEGALAVVSGRPLIDINRIFEPAKLAACGAHGTEYQDAAGASWRSTTGALPIKVTKVVAEFAERHPGLLHEVKPLGVALHYRQAPELEQKCRALMEVFATELGDEYRLLHGKMVLEWTPRAAGKGTAVETFLGRSPFLGRTPVFAGDDVTDEDGFDAVNRLGGVSIRVGNAAETMANYSVPDVVTLRSWLDSITI